MAKNMDKYVEAGQSLATVFVGLMVAGGSALQAPLVSMIPAVVHTWGGYIIAVLGAVGLTTKLMK